MEMEMEEDIVAVSHICFEKMYFSTTS